FCKQSADIDKLKQLFLQDKIEQIKSKKFLEDYLSLNVYFAFKIQLLHLGVLLYRRFQDDRKSGGFSGKYTDYDFEKDMWILD
ncbi:MAG: hypothetical protein JW870_13595, partial [Candidatus Delongbacteria bacterium]|nr:hypothetical protein [Candidatus Delongbacteria bacterium]